MLKSLLPLILGKGRIPYVEETKYFGARFDQRFTWNPHIQKSTNIATIAPGKCMKLRWKKLGTWLEDDTVITPQG